jgi:hypothetical protein
MEGPGVGDTRTLCVLLASPPTTSGARTLNAIAVAAQCLQTPQIVTANLLAKPARDLAEMSSIGAQATAWEAARADLHRAVTGGDLLLAAWGLNSLTGPARHHHNAQVEWLLHTAEEAGHTHAWTLGGEPRHPSRWHQFSSDLHGRTPPGLSREDRVRTLLTRVALMALLPASGRRPSPAVP